MECVLIDTPGLQDGTKALNVALKRNANFALKNSETVAYVVDPLKLMEYGFSKDREALSKIKSSLFGENSDKKFTFNVFPVFTRADRLNKKFDKVYFENELSKLLNEFFLNVKQSSWISNYKSDSKNLDLFMNLVSQDFQLHPKGAWFNSDDLTDKSMRELVLEFVREQCFLQLGQELPYSIAAEMEYFDEKTNPKLPYIQVTLHVERDSQKGIVVGKGGEKIKIIGSKSREKVEHLLQKKVFLGLKVKVTPHWAKEEKWVEKFGYDESTN